MLYRNNAKLYTLKYIHVLFFFYLFFSCLSNILKDRCE